MAADTTPVTRLGERLERRADDIDGTNVRALVRRGAVVVFESGGCGGRGCRPVWLDPADVRAAAIAAEPVIVGGGGTPTWADVWGTDRTSAVFLHGDVTWGTLLGSREWEARRESPEIRR